MDLTQAGHGRENGQVTVDERLASLEARLRVLEDERAILHLLATYGPLVDSGACDEAAALWTADGVYDVGGVGPVQGHHAIAALYEGDVHQGLIHTGSGHVTGLPQIRIDGDNATAIAHSFVLLREEDAWKVWRASANDWTLRRMPDGWRIVERRNRPLDGSPASHGVLRRAAD